MKLMGTETRTDRQYGSEQLFLLPEQIQVDDHYNVRTYGEGEECNGDLLALAATIERDGQLDAGIVQTAANHPEHYILVAGHRRRRAIALINERRSAEGKPLLRMRVIVDRNGDPLRKAIVSNLHRRDFSPMDLARLITRIRREYQWEEQTTKVAAYLGMSAQKIREHEKFLKADKLVQDRLHQGVLSWQSATELLRAKVPENRIADVIERAQDLQADVEAQKPTAKRGTRIEHPSVRKAIRESQYHGPEVEFTDLSRQISEVWGKKSASAAVTRSRKEILDWIESLDSPAVREGVRKWARYFVDVWAKGGGSDATLRARFDGLYAGPHAIKRKH